jgi:integrase
MYRAVRRAAGKDQPRRPRSLNTDGHIPRAWFRQEIWIPTLEKVGLGFDVRFHDLRHAHASWLLAGGADIQVVKERMGHSSIMTTQKYLHTLPNADAAAVVALDSIRKRIA